VRSLVQRSDTITRSGIEGDIDWSNIGGRVTGPVMGIPATFETQLSWLNTFRGRVGYAFGPIFPYLTGGGAFGGIRARTQLRYLDREMSLPVSVTCDSDGPRAQGSNTDR
jgi:hypothetical protein